MRVNLPYVSLPKITEPVTHPSTSRTDKHQEDKNPLSLPGHDSTLIAGVKQPLRNASSKAVTAATTIHHSKLDKVSDPKLEIKKEATAPNGLYGVDYSVPVPSTGLNNITFPISIEEGLQRKTDKDAGIYYAMHYRVNHDGDKYLGRGYIGIQPRGDGKVLVLFSGYGPHFTASKGRAEFDGVKGASNSTLVDFKFGNKYNLTVERDSTVPRQLSAYIQDVTDPDNPGPKQHVKDLTVDREFTLANRDIGFVEHYGSKINRSSQIAPTSGSFSAPFTTDDKGNIKTGSINSTGLYGRYKNAIVGDQQVTKESGVGKNIHFSLQGVGYEKKA